MQSGVPLGAAAGGAALRRLAAPPCGPSRYVCFPGASCCCHLVLVPAGAEGAHLRQCVRSLLLCRKRKPLVVRFAVHDRTPGSTTPQCTPPAVCSQMVRPDAASVLMLSVVVCISGRR